MRRKIFTLLMTLCVVSILVVSQAVFADTGSGSVVFLDAASGTAINEIDTAKSVRAQVGFTAPETGKANVITAAYDILGAMISHPLVETVEVTAGEDVVHTTAPFSSTGAQTVKVFVWMADSAILALTPNGILDKEFTGGAGFSAKLSAIQGKTEGSPYITIENAEISAGELFEAATGAEINSKYFSISAQPMGDSAAEAEFVPDTQDWTKGTVKFSGTGLIKLTAQDYDFCIPVESYVNIIEPIDRYTTKFEHTDEFLYRVGNSNTVSLSSLFAAAMPELPVSDVKVTIDGDDFPGDATGKFTTNADWTKGTVKFDGTGVVRVTISDYYSNPTSLLLEVVNAKNVTTYDELSKTNNNVLLNDITMTSGGSIRFSNVALYGNGFTFDVTKGKVEGENVLDNYLVCLSNSTLDNVSLVGAVYTQYGATSSSDYNRSVVLSSGNSTISNCYISNCASPVRAYGGNLEIINSTLKGGNFANLDIRNGYITLDNVTTINQVKDNDLAEDGTVVVGLGVVVYYEQVLNTTTIEIKNGITQYNYFSKKQADTYISDSTAKTLTNGMFSSTYSALQYKDGTDTWVNAGIISMTSEVGDDNISDVEGYGDASPTVTGTTGYVHTKKPDATSISAEVPAYVTTGQYAIAPTFSFEYPKSSSDANYIAKTEGSNEYCYYDNGTILVSFDEGNSLSFNTSILTVTKAGQDIDYTVTMNGADYTGKAVTFEEAGDYTLTYTYTDANNYTVDASGNVSTYAKTYTKNVFINVSEVKPDAKNAEFNFVSTGLATKTVHIGNDTYVMPDATSTSSTIGSTTVSGTKIYYPIVEAYTSDGKYEHGSFSSWYMCFPVFKNVITITDYADSGTGDAIIYDGSTTELPSGLAAENPGTTFLYRSSGSAPETPGVLKSVLIYKSPTLSNNARPELTVRAKYTYQDNTGAIYYYYVGYHCPETKESCLIPGTLISLADGTQKAIEDITYEDELLVWDFYEGTYDKAKAAIIFNHGYSDNTIIKLKFKDGTTISIVNLHQFFDAEENKFVNVTADTVGSLVGHKFVKADGRGYKVVELVDYEISQENTRAYGIISSGHYNIIAEGMLTTDFEPQDTGLFNYFDVGENLTYKNVEQDVERYGLYTYEDFARYLTPELFDAFNVKYMKVAVGKGYYTYEAILGLIEKWLTGNDEVVPISDCIKN